MISIFASRLWRSRSPDSHLAPFSAVIRGNQVAERIGARLNPEAGYEQDVCIYVKHAPLVERLGEFMQPPYIDLVDGYALRRTLQQQPGLRANACSQVDYATLAGQLSNPVVLIPQQHCNFERQRRTGREIKTVGIIGTWYAWQHLPAGLAPALAERGVQLWQYSDFVCRQDVVDFYLGVDVQVVWRPYPKPLSNPLKLVNAASFGVPTIALDEPAFKEMEGCYLPVETVEELLARLDALHASPSMYAEYAQRGIEKAEAYHIDKIAALYKELDGR